VAPAKPTSAVNSRHARASVGNCDCVRSVADAVCRSTRSHHYYFCGGTPGSSLGRPLASLGQRRGACAVSSGKPVAMRPLCWSMRAADTNRRSTPSYHRVAAVDTTPTLHNLSGTPGVHPGFLPGLQTVEVEAYGAKGLLMQAICRTAAASQPVHTCAWQSDHITRAPPHIGQHGCHDKPKNIFAAVTPCNVRVCVHMHWFMCA